MAKKSENNNSIMQISNDMEGVADVIDSGVTEIVTASHLQGIKKAFLLATATKKIKDALSKEYMSPIMELQGSKLGFLTDKDREGGYPMPVVKNCLIEAILTGIQPVGNHFNIIGGNMYITKEGFGYLLKNTKGLTYKITPHLPNVKGESAAVRMAIEWNLNGNKGAHTIEFPVKINKYQSVDAVIGKGTRKARAWLFNHITDSEFSDGDISDFSEAQVVSSTSHNEVSRKSKMSDMFKEEEQNKESEQTKNTSEGSKLFD